MHSRAGGLTKMKQLHRQSLQSSRLFSARRSTCILIGSLLFALCGTVQSQIQWTEVTLPDGIHHPMIFPQDSIRCTLIGERQVYVTEDGGNSWNVTLTSERPLAHADINRTGAGVILCDDRSYQSTDFGHSWDSTTSNIDPWLRQSFGSVARVAALSATNAVVLFDEWLYESSDGFTTLYAMNRPFERVHGFLFADSLSGIASGFDSLAFTSDGGRSWTEQLVPGCAGVLGYVPGGPTVIAMGDPSPVYAEDPQYSFDEQNWFGLAWPADAEQLVWPRVPEADYYIRDVAMVPADEPGRFWLAYSLDRSEYSMLYEVVAPSHIRFLGRIPCIDDLVSTGDGTAWAVRSSIEVEKLWRVRDMREDPPSLSATDVSTEERPGVLLTLREGADASPWTAAVIERYGPEASWTPVDTLYLPRRVLLDTDVENGETYQYRAEITLESGGTYVQEGGSISLSGAVVIDLADFLLPPPHTTLTYVRDGIVPLHESYEYLGSTDTLGVARVHAYRGIRENMDGQFDTARVSFAEVFSDPPAVHFLRHQEPQPDIDLGWHGLSTGDSLADWYYSTELTLGGFTPWLYERFVPIDEARIVDDTLRMHRGDTFPAANTFSVQVTAVRNRGIVKLVENLHVLHVRSTTTITLQSTTSAVELIRPAPASIQANWPNPFSGSTSVAIQMDHAGPLRLSVHDALGREVTLLTDSWRDAGRHVFNLDAHGLPAGVYFLRAVFRDHVLSRKLLHHPAGN